ncbi:MAG: 50S ribosomal protein L2 [Holosporaceae bacterium]
MSLRVYKPVTPGQRGTVLIDRSKLWKKGPLRSLTQGMAKKGGRCATGRLTAYHRGGGHKKRYRLIDFKRQKYDVAGRVERFEYDPNRSAFIALVAYEDGEKAYILAPQKLEVGDTIVASEKADIKPGNALPLYAIPQGTFLHNVEMKIKKGGQIARAAGTSVRLLGRDGGYALLSMTSGEVRRISEQCWATVGVLSNPDRKNESLGKAGRNRWRGRRPHVRGVAMNPIDHPHGGGEGKTSGGRHPVSPWGQPTKGKRTRSNKRTDWWIVKRRAP